MNQASRPPVLLLTGATAVGKTDLALSLADHYPVDLISVDAAQVYRGMNIGTAKPDAQTLKAYPHALVDIREPEQAYSAADFRQDALALIASSFASGRIPLLVGGSLFYFSALIHGLSSLPTSSNEVRQALAAEAAENGLDALHDQLQTIDAELAARIKPGDRQRLMRALELFRMTGERPSALYARSQPEPCPWPILHFSLFRQPRAYLHQRIERRFLDMIEQGLVEEVEELRGRPGLRRDSVAMRTVGYRQVWSYLDGDIDHEQMINQAVAASRQLAKRQLTWVRHLPGTVWLDAGMADKLSIVQHFLEANANGFVV